MTMFHLLKIRTSIDIFKNEKFKVTLALSIYHKHIYVAILIMGTLSDYCG